MIIRDGVNEYEVRVQLYTALFDSGIDWTRVGPKYHALDRGTGTKRWSSDVTIRENSLAVIKTRELILSAVLAGGTFEIECEEYEKVFGPEVDYTLPIECTIDASEDPFITENLNLDVPTEWTFSLRPLLPLYYLYPLATWPTSGLGVQSVTRLTNAGIAFNELEESRVGVGFGHEIRTAEVVYEGDSETVGKAKTYLHAQRANTFTMTNALVWLFDEGDVSQAVKVLSVEDDGQLDKAGLLHRFTAVFAKV
jgi:hypothetical protein